MEKTLVSSGSPFEHVLGSSRAVRVGAHISVSGTAPIGLDRQTAHPGDVFGQTRRCIEIMLRAIEEAGGAREDVVRTRIMLVDMSGWREAARAHSEIFADVKPACTVVEVSGFIDPDWLVETEADCYVTGRSA